jgi:hypothetical protein
MGCIRLGQKFHTLIFVAVIFNAKTQRRRGAKIFGTGLEWFLTTA